MNPYTVLGVDENDSLEKIEDAYRDRIKEVHPDTGGDIEQFKRVRQAYEDIKNQHDNNRSHEETTKYYSRNVYPSNVEYISYKYIQQKGLEMDSKAFENARSDDLDPSVYGSFKVKEGESVLEAAERTGHSWPFSCRGGACSNCAVKIVNGDIGTPEYAILNKELLRNDYRLSCIGKPLTSNVQLIFGVRDREEIQELLLPPQD